MDEPTTPPIDPGAGPARRAPGPNRRWVKLSAAAVVPAALVIGAAAASADRGADAGGTTSGAAADAATDADADGHRDPGHRGRGTQGTITAVDDTGLTVATDDGDVTVAVDDDTRVLATTDGSLADVAVGDRLIVTGTEADDGTVAATRVAVGDDLAAGRRGGSGGPGRDGGAGGGRRGHGGHRPSDDDQTEDDTTDDEDGSRRHPRAGTVTAIDGTTITVETVRGDTVTVTTGADTEFTVTSEITLADLAVDDEVHVAGRTDDGTITARLIHRGRA